MAATFVSWRTGRGFLFPILLIALSLLCETLSRAEQQGIINDPDGYVNVRSEARGSARVIARVKENQPFEFEWAPEGERCEVKLSSGTRGWMHHSRIRLHFTRKDLPQPAIPGKEPSEIDDAARARGIDYVKTTAEAARGDRKSLRDFFQLGPELDGAAAESNHGIPTVVYHLLGDAAFARLLDGEPQDKRVLVRNAVLADARSIPEIESYMQRHFPRTAALLFRDEIIGWTSPDGRYAIRKRFSGWALGESKVERAELIEKATGRVITDLTASDIGVAYEREGSVLWSPNSRRFAYLSSDLRYSEGSPFRQPPPTPQRKQTVVFQQNGESFEKVDLTTAVTAPAQNDPRLKGAVMGHEHTEPVRWDQADVLVLQRHEYYQKLAPSSIGNVKFEAVTYFDRMFRIIAKMNPTGTAEISCEEQRDRSIRIGEI